MSDEILGYIKIPRGEINQKSYTPPLDISRAEYINARNREDVSTGYKNYSKFEHPQLIHLERVDTIDFYPEDTRRVFSLFLSYYGEGKLYVVTGFRSPLIHGLSAHSTGLAMDIIADSPSHAIKICNSAYRAGIPNIVLGGDFDSGQGYVHLDISPKGDFSYNSGVYTGPWS